MLGWSREELESKTVHEALPPERAERLALILRAVLAGHRRVFEWKATRGERVYEVESGAVRNDAGEGLAAT